MMNTAERMKTRVGDRPSKGTRGRLPEPVPVEHADAIIEWIAQGKTLRQWCRDHEIHYGTVYLWLAKDKIFAQRFAEARAIGADCIAEEVLAIADTTQEGVTTRITERGVEETREDMLGHRKLQVETRLKLLAKWFPQKYGDKVDLQHGGSITLTVATGIPDAEVD
jgi:hypothetical protein